MNWIQNFFDMFKKEDDAENQPLHKTTLATSQENSKDLEARITFQYPKGQFRFPVIPDDKKRINHHDHNNRKPKNRNPEIRTKSEKISAKIEPIAKSKKYSYSAFRPTEIPSPIFGFNRPKEAVIEYELSQFLKETPYKDESKGYISKEKAGKDDEMEKISTPLIETEIISQQELENMYMAKEQTDDFTESASAEAAQVIVEDTAEAAQVIVEDTANLMTAQSESTWDEEATNDHGTSAINAETDSNPDGSHFEKPKKQHLPFNVLMLKQDKQKCEEMNKKRRELLHVPMAKTLETDTFIEGKVEEPSVQQEGGLYSFPAYELLNPPVTELMDTEWLLEQEKLLNQTLENFNVGAKAVNVTQGPSVTRYEVQPEPGVKVNKVTNLADDIKLSLAARDIRIEAPIPGKHTIGIEVPNQKSRPVFISEIIKSQVFRESISPLTAVLGLDISGKPIVTDLKKMPHGLIAGATGSGKSVCINTMLISLLFKASPEDLKLLLIDPKMVELAPYNQIPHLVSPVITDVKAATAALKWAVEEMERRYELFAHTGVRDVNRFNELASKDKRYSDKLPFIVIIIDELADLMMMSPADVEEAICRIAQKARACGIHLIIATQRPSVDVITGLIKANIPTRIAFSVSSQVDSRTIIDMSGAEKLLGRGDMLFLENGSSKPVRLQGTFVSDDEIEVVVEHVRMQQEPEYLFVQEELLKKAQVSEEEDELFLEACEFVVEQNGASTSSLQRRFKIGYNRAARLMDLMEQQGYISGAKGSKPRDVLITETDLEAIQEAGS